MVPLFPALRRRHAQPGALPCTWPPTAGRSTNKGRALSKSRGNDVDPVEIANRMGGEIVRLWVASVDFREDVVGSEQLMQRVAESYRKIRNNLFRYVLGNLYDFDPRQERGALRRSWTSLDQYMLRQTAAMAADVTRWYDEFAFHKIYQRITEFLRGGLERVLLRCAERPPVHLRAELSGAAGRADRDLAHRRSAGAAARAHHELHLRRSVAVSAQARPIVRRACIWQLVPEARSDILGSASPADDPKQREDWTTLAARSATEVLKALEEARKSKLIGGANLEAQVTVTAADPVYLRAGALSERLRYLFIVSAVTLEQGASGNGTGGVSVQVSKADGKKCERCWNYSTHVGEDPASIPRYASAAVRC